jgi:purine nucleosidase
MTVGLIIDTDVGSDDLIAIAYLLQHEQRQRDGNISKAAFHLEAITVVRGLCTVNEGVRNLKRLLKLCNREDICVYAGETFPLDGVRDRCFPAPWTKDTNELPGVVLPELDIVESDECSANDDASIKRKLSPAVNFLIERFRETCGRCRVLALGPLTNIALALQNSCPGSQMCVDDVTIMGGAFSVPGNLFFTQVVNTHAEWNMYIDPHAAHYLCSQRSSCHQFPMYFVSLDATNCVPMNREFIDQFFNLEEEAGVLGEFICQVIRSHGMYIQTGEMYAWVSRLLLFAVRVF